MCVKILNGGFEFFAEISIASLLAQILVCLFQQLQLLRHVHIAAFLGLSRLFFRGHYLSEGSLLLRQRPMLRNQCGLLPGELLHCHETRCKCLLIVGLGLFIFRELPGDFGEAPGLILICVMESVKEILHLFMLGVCFPLGFVDFFLLHELPGDGVGGIGHNPALLGHDVVQPAAGIGGFFAFVYKQLLEFVNVADYAHFYIHTFCKLLRRVGVCVKQPAYLFVELLDFIYCLLRDKVCYFYITHQYGVIYSTIGLSNSSEIRENP